MIHDPTGRISLHHHAGRVRVLSGETVIADSDEAIELRETGYPSRQYLPRRDVDMSRLVRSQKVTHCPFKGDASYFSVEVGDNILTDAVWSYEQPFEAVAEIAGYVAFDTRVVDEQVSDSH